MTHSDRRAIDRERLNRPDPDYAPCLRKVGDMYYWRLPRKYKGYRIKNVRLEGTPREMAERCRSITRELLMWWENGGDLANARRDWETWGDLTTAYRSDKFSSFNTVKPNTRADYAHKLGIIDSAICDVPLSDTDYPRMMMWQDSMKKKGRSTHYIKAWFTMLRGVVSHAAMQRPEDQNVGRIQRILSHMRIKNPKPRNVAPTEEEAFAIIKAAHDLGEHSMAIGLQIQWWSACRAVDVRGIWMPGNGSGIRHNGRYWADGLVWGEHLDTDCTRIEKLSSKTEQEIHLDLTLVPGLRKSLLATENKVGPVILSRTTGRPYDTTAWSKLFQKVREHAGISTDLKANDFRAGAITDAKRMGISAREVSQVAGHTNLDTTTRYIRDARETQAQVLALRTSKERLAQK